MKKVNARIPKNLQGILWSKAVSEIDPKTDRVYLIHQVLRYGSLKDINWLFHFCPRSQVIKTFLEAPLPVYDLHSFNFVRSYILKIENGLDQNAYIKALYTRKIV